MKRISVMANDSLLVDAIAAILAEEVGPDVLQLTYQLPCNAYGALRDHRSMVIVIDEGESEFELSKVPDTFTNNPLLFIKAHLKTMNINVHKSYQLLNPRAEQITQLVRDFRTSYLGRIDQEVMTWAT
jgi:hypothetical protein